MKYKFPKPQDVEPEPILCWVCLSENRLQHTWENEQDELVCPIHGPVITIRS